MSVDAWVASDVWLNELLDAHAEEVEARDLLVHREFDAGFRMGRDPELAAALEALFRFVLSTIPGGCELYVASSRNEAPVTRLGSGMLTLRWQVAGPKRSTRGGSVTALRPILGGAAAHARSKGALELMQAFADLDIRIEFIAAPDDRELWARVRIE